MRVVMIITSYHPIVGGAERQLAQLAQRMDAAGCEVHVVTRGHRGLAAQERFGGALVHRIPAPGPKPVAAAAFLLGAARKAAALKPDVIHCHSLFSPAIAGALAKRLRPAPLLAKPMCGGEATQIAAKRFGRARLAWLARALDRVVVISHEIDAELRGLGLPAEKLVFIPNGVDISRFGPADAEGKAALRARLGLPADGPLVVFAGRLTAQKRLPLLLEAWRDVVAAAPEATLLVAGANRAAGATVVEENGGFDTTLLDAPGVRPLGHVEDIPALFAAADVFVLPSASEGLSNALLEACAAGLAVVASRVGGAEDVIAHGRNGLLFEVDDRDALRDALTTLCRDGALRARLGAAARETVAGAYDIDGTVAALSALYRKLGTGER